MAGRKIILKRRNSDSEGDRYQYFKSCKNGVEITTPFKNEATVLIEQEPVKVVSRDWKAVLFRK